MKIHPNVQLYYHLQYVVNRRSMRLRVTGYEKHPTEILEMDAFSYVLEDQLRNTRIWYFLWRYWKMCPLSCLAPIVVSDWQEQDRELRHTPQTSLMHSAVTVFWVCDSRWRRPAVWRDVVSGMILIDIRRSPSLLGRQKDPPSDAVKTIWMSEMILSLSLLKNTQ